MEKEWGRKYGVEQSGLPPDMDFVESPQPRATSKTPLADARKVGERFDLIGEQMNELSKLVALKTERLAIKVKLSEERHQTFIEDVQQKLTALTVRAAERPRVDSKVEEMIEKHNQVMRTMENRLLQLKRLIESQEVELYKVVAELQEARKEIARLRR